MTVKQMIDDIMDIFGGADGGVQFARIKHLLENLEIQANEGDLNSQQIIKIVKQFHRLVTLKYKRV